MAPTTRNSENDGLERASRSLADELEAIAQELDSFPVQDDRSAEEILGYDEAGLPD